MNPHDLRIGHGFDLHRFAPEFTPGKPLVLGGVTLPDALSLEAHSDGDVIVHALCDALLGAAGEADIGQQFPPNQPEFAGIDSMALLDRVMKILRGKGLAPVNADLTVVAERPRLAPYRDPIRSRLAAALGIPLARCNVKATTAEGLGSIGRGAGIASHAVVLLASAA